MSSMAARGRATRVRWFPILAMVFVATLINYTNRSIFGFAKPLMVADLHIDAFWAGMLGSCFAWTYAAAQIPAGAFLDKFGTRFTYAFSLVTWSFFTTVQGLVSSVGLMFGARMGLGLCEAPCFPANSRVLAHWFPQAERARANAIYSIGMYGGIAFLAAPLALLIQAYGWRTMFVLTGLAGIAFGAVWYLIYREPHESRLVNQAELDHIAAGGALKSSAAQKPFRWNYLLQLLTFRQIVCASIAQFGGNAVLTFFLLDFVNYLVTQRHFGFLHAGIFASIPYMAAAVGGLAGGQVSDLLLTKTGNANLARKLPIVTGLILASLLPLAILIPEGQDGLIIAAMSLVFFGQGITNQGWTVISDIAPASLLGVTGGLFNLVTNLSGILIPVIIGFVVEYTGSYNNALIFTGALPLLGAFLYVFVMGDIKRLEIVA
jgi:ACS family D-galactonate transporter-like MFS transporter